MSSYYKMFKSPVNKTQLKPLSNLIQSSTSSKIFEKNFTQKLQSSMKEYLTTVNDSTSKLKEFREDFLTPEKIVTTDDTKNNITINANQDSNIEEYNINVLNIAKEQTNSGYKFWPNEKTQLNPGERSFLIKFLDKEEKFTVNIDEKDTNNNVLEKINSNINDSNLNISSSIEQDKGKIFLRLKGNETGTKNSFDITDKNGNLTMVMGIKNISTMAEDSKITVNETNLSSSSNNISLDNNNIKLQLNNTTKEPINFKIDINNDSIKQNIEKLILSYNNIITTANNNIDNFNGAKILKSDLVKIVNDDSINLENIGLYTNNDNTISINYKELDDSIKNNLSSIKKVFSSNNGFVSKLSKKGSEIISKPSFNAKSANFARNYEAISNYTKLNNSTPAKYLKGSLFDTLL